MGYRPGDDPKGRSGRYDGDPELAWLPVPCPWCDKPVTEGTLYLGVRYHDGCLADLYRAEEAARG